MAQNPYDQHRKRPPSGSGQGARRRKEAHPNRTINTGNQNQEGLDQEFLTVDLTPRTQEPPQAPHTPEPVRGDDYEYDYVFLQGTPSAQPAAQPRRTKGNRPKGAHQEGKHTAANHPEGKRVAQSSRGGEHLPQKKKKKKKRRSVLKGLYTTIVILALLIVVGYGAYKTLIQPPSLGDPDLGSQEMLEGGVMPGLSGGKYPHRAQTYTFLLVCPDQESGNADAIMVVTYDVPNQKVGMLSIPRDTLVNEKFPKINASYHSGIENLSRVVSELTGLDFNFTVEIDLDAIAELVEQVGGIDFNVPVEMYYDDPVQDLHIHFKPGMQYLNGQQAVEVCRFRHNADGTGYPLGDVQRSETVRNVMVTTAKKLVSFSNLGKVNEFIKIFQRNVQTNLKTSDIIWFATQALQLDLSSGVSSGSLEGDGSVTYGSTKYCYQIYPDKALETINELVNPYTQTLTAEDLNIFQVK